MNNFNNDERIIINKVSEGTSNLKLTKESVLANFRFARNISTDSAILDLLDGLIAKAEQISEDEWKRIFDKLPLATDYEVEDAEEVSTLS